MNSSLKICNTLLHSVNICFIVRLILIEFILAPPQRCFFILKVVFINWLHRRCFSVLEIVYYFTDNELYHMRYVLFLFGNWYSHQHTTVWKMVTPSYLVDRALGNVLNFQRISESIEDPNLKSPQNSLKNWPYETICEKAI